MRQVLGEVLDAVDVGDRGDVAVIGAGGLLCVGKRLRALDRVAAAHASLEGLLAVVRATYERTNILAGQVDALERTCRLAERNRVSAEGDVRAARGRLCAEAAALAELHGRLAAAAADVRLPPPPTDPAGRALWGALRVGDAGMRAEEQARDLGRRVALCQRRLRAMREDVRTFQGVSQGDVAREVVHDTVRMGAVAQARERRAAALLAVEAAVAGLAGLALLDAVLSGRTTQFLPPPENAAAAGTSSAAGDGGSLSSLAGAISGSGGGRPEQWTPAADQTPAATLILHGVFTAAFVWAVGRWRRWRRRGTARTCEFELDRPVSLARLDGFLRRLAAPDGAGGALSAWLGLGRLCRPARRATEDDAASYRYAGSPQAAWHGPVPEVELVVDRRRAALRAVRCRQHEAATGPLGWLLWAVLGRQRLGRSAAVAASGALLAAVLEELAAAGVFQAEALGGIGGGGAGGAGGGDDMAEDTGSAGGGEEGGAGGAGTGRDGGSEDGAGTRRSRCAARGGACGARAVSGRVWEHAGRGRKADGWRAG